MNSSIGYVLWVLLKGYRQQVFRVLIVYLAIIIGCAGFSSVLVLNETAKRSYSHGSHPFLENVHYAIYAKGSGTISKSDYAHLRKSGHRNIVAVSTHQAAAKDIANLTFIGVDIFAIKSLNKHNSNMLESTAESKLFSNNSKFIFHPDYASQLATLGVLNQDSYLLLDSGQKVGPVSFANTVSISNQIVSDIETLFNQFTLNSISYLLVVGDDQDNLPTQIPLPEHLELLKLNTGEDASQLTGSFHLNLLAMGLLMFVVCMFIVLNALNLLMIKRVPTFKILRQLGIPRNSIFLASILEMLVVAVICSALGVILGIQIASWLSPAVNQTLESLYNVKIGFEAFSWLNLYAQVLFASMLGLSIAAILPLRSVNQHLASIKSPPLTSSNHNKWLALAAIMILVGLIIYASNNSIIGSFAVISLLIVSGCFMVLYLLPKLLFLLIHLVPLKMPVVHWCLADAKRVSNKSNIAFCAFFIAVTANVGMNLMVTSFRVATDSWITQRLNAEAYVYTQETDKVVDLLNQQFPAISAIIRKEQIGDYHGKSIQIRSYPVGIRHQSAIQLEQSQDDLWRSFSAGNGVLINQQFALSLSVSLGQTIQINRQRQDSLTLQVVGVYYDYGNPRAQALIHKSLLADHVNGRNVIGLYTQNAQPATLPLVKKALAINIPDAEMMNTAELLQASMQTFDRTFVVTQSLNIITLLVAGFSLASSLIVIDYDNKPQRALIRALGVPARSILLSMLFQYSVLSMFICAVAIPFGILLSWLLIQLINVQAFFWSYPLIVEWQIIAQIILSSLAVVLLVVVVPATKAVLKPPIEDIKWLNG